MCTYVCDWTLTSETGCAVVLIKMCIFSCFRSLRYVDCRLCFGHTVNRATIEADMNLLYKENTCFLPKETLEEDIHSSVTASSKQVLPPKENATFTGGMDAALCVCTDLFCVVFK